MPIRDPKRDPAVGDVFRKEGVRREILKVIKRGRGIRMSEWLTVRDGDGLKRPLKTRQPSLYQFQQWARKADVERAAKLDAAS